MNYKKTLISFFLLIISVFSIPYKTNAQQEGSETFYKAEILKILEEGQRESEYESEFFQKARIKILDGEQEGKELTIDHKDFVSEMTEQRKLVIGQTVVIHQIEHDDQVLYIVVDKYRLPALIYIFLFFFIIVLLLGKLRGIGGLLGLIISIIIIIAWIIPQIVMGGNPLLTCILGAFAIAVLSLYSAHGISKRTTLAVISTLITLVLALIFALLFVWFGNLYGLGSEEAFFIQLGPLDQINLKGLLLGSIIIGALGVLDDVTSTQTAVINEICKANPNFSFIELYKRGISVGREHIASMINTLALAYVGASFPMFLLFTLNKTQPLWLILNSEFIAEEIVRTLVGSTALVLAVPISTGIAAYFLKKKT